jgi:hypothetical protein
VLLHVLTHIYSDDVVLIVKEILSKGQSLNVNLQNKSLKIIKVMSKSESKTFKVNCY